MTESDVPLFPVDCRARAVAEIWSLTPSETRAADPPVITTDRSGVMSADAHPSLRQPAPPSFAACNDAPAASRLRLKHAQAILTVFIIRWLLLSTSNIDPRLNWPSILSGRGLGRYTEALEEIEAEVFNNNCETRLWRLSCTSAVECPRALGNTLSPQGAGVPGGMQASHELRGPSCWDD
jgi:hypothetical protein